MWRRFLQRLFKFSAATGGDLIFLLGHLSSQDIKSLLPKLKLECLLFYSFILLWQIHILPALTSNTLHFAHTVHWYFVRLSTQYQLLPWTTLTVLCCRDRSYSLWGWNWISIYNVHEICQSVSRSFVPFMSLLLVYISQRSKVTRQCTYGKGVVLLGCSGVRYFFTAMITHSMVKEYTMTTHFERIVTQVRRKLHKQLIS
jgi:hypothetical protein